MSEGTGACPRSGRVGTGAVARTAAAYAAHAASFLRRWGRRAYRRPPLLRDLLALVRPRAALLDLGSGAGQDARFLRAKHYRVVGLDRTRPLLLHARRRSRRLPLVLGDMRALPFRPASFDAIWAAASLIHLLKPEARRLLRTLRTFVPPGGLLAATVAQGRHVGFLRAGWIPGRYFARWKKAELARAVRRAGWTVLHLEAVTNRERKGRWLNLIAQRSGRKRD